MNGHSFLADEKADSCEIGSGMLAAADPARPVVLILCTAFPPDSITGAARPGRFARYLPEYGYEPIVICQAQPEQDSSEEWVRRVPPPVPGRAARLLGEAARVMQRYLLPYNDNLPWAAHALVEAESVLSLRRVAAVLSTSPPVACHLAALALRQHHRLPWVADFRDPLCGNPFRSRRWFFPYDTMLERLFFKHADALVANTDAVATLWEERYPGVSGKVRVIWNGYDPEARLASAMTSGGSRRVLAHVGSLYGGRHPGRLITSLARLVLRGELAPDSFLVRLVGVIEDSSLGIEAEAVAALESWGCLEYNGLNVPQAEARHAIAQADCLLLLDLNERNCSLQVPAKLFEYVQVGRPILAYTPRNSPTEHILSRCGVRYHVVDDEMSDPEADRAVLGFLALPTDPVPPNSWFENRFNGRNQAAELAAILDAESGRLSRSGVVTVSRSTISTSIVK